MGSLRLFKDFLTRFHRSRAFLASRLSVEILRRFSVLWARRSTTPLSERGSSLIYCWASACSSQTTSTHPFHQCGINGSDPTLAGPLRFLGEPGTTLHITNCFFIPY